MKRRNFLGLAATYTGGWMVVPKFITSFTPVTPGADQNNILVFIQLNGGNDGLNTYIPYDNPLYYEWRKNIYIPKEKIIGKDMGSGWHPALKDFSQMQQDGQLTIIQNVGYPNPNRSHFRSQEIWQTASASDTFLTKGWLGRFLDIHCNDLSTASVNFDKIDNLALKGNEVNTITIKSPDRLNPTGVISPDTEMSDNPQLDFVRKIVHSSSEGMAEIKKALKVTKEPTVAYSKSDLGENLKWIARMIKGKLNTFVYYTSLNGFDTHNNQLGSHARQLGILNDAVYAFYKDLKSENLLNKVTLVIFSEFGRRVKDNGNGTDHGTAGPMFIIGGQNQGNIIGHSPNLEKLDNGDLIFETDFRSVYATLLRKKFNLDPKEIRIDQAIIPNIFG
jgi:uncharacterized protein (DUF1501 family)